jgi:hypothetical protein
MQTPAKNTTQPSMPPALYFTAQQHVLRMESEGGQGANPNRERASMRDLPRIDQWWLAGRITNNQSH